MPLAAAHRYNNDNRDQGRKARNQVTGGPGGAFRCHYAGECARVCPKGVDPARAVQLMKRQLVLDYLHLAGSRKSCRRLDGPGQGKPLSNITPAPPRTVTAEESLTAHAPGRR
jgi:succinate dehydrogenase / fumarate reductase iron-sulfur subunit